jgi:threonyl-tRNA synthetase
MESASDHRIIGQRLDLWHFEEVAPGMVHWHPRGLALYEALLAAARARLRADDYREVRTPQLLRRPVWEASGHWQHFQQNMFRVADDDSDAALKPVSCPAHLQIARAAALSYRDLPFRLSEFGVVHRDERSGTLHGLMRLRQFTQDDGHVFAAPEQIAAELDRFLGGVAPFYAAFGFHDLGAALSLRPPSRVGSEADWDFAEAELRAALERLGVAFAVQPGEGAFYGPKIEFSLADRFGRRWQCGTIQLDIAMPARFDVSYARAGGGRAAPMMLHRALYGSVERFLGVLLEHHAGRLPPWLAPVQALVLPVGEAEQPAARRLVHELVDAGLRAEHDCRDATLGKRIAEAHVLGAPLVLVIGPREVSAGTVMARDGSERRSVALADVVGEVRARCAAPPFVPQLTPGAS